MTLIRLISGISFATLLSSPAFAEVCDKVNPDWNPDEGPIGLLENTIDFFSNEFGLAIVLLAVVSFVLRKRWLYFTTSAASAVRALLELPEWQFGDGVYQAAMREGCRASPVLPLTLLLGLCALSLWFAIKQTQAD